MSVVASQVFTAGTSLATVKMAMTRMYGNSAMPTLLRVTVCTSLFSTMVVLL